MLKLTLYRCLGAAAIAGLSATEAGAQNAQLSAAARTRMQAQISALAAEKDLRTPAQEKMSSQFVRADMERKTGRASNGAPRLKTDVKIRGNGKVLADITAKVSPALLTAIERAGGTVINHFAIDDAIRAELPLAAIEGLAGREDVDFIEPAHEAETNVGARNSEGDVAHRADLVRSRFGATGAGVKIGVLSDSIDFLADSQASNDLPTVAVLPRQEGEGSGEGTAMLELIHDLAPDAQLYFATGFNSAASMADNIRKLADAGCNVVVDDVTYFSESPFQDDTISRAVNDISDQGVLFFSSARNSGNKNDGTSSTWEGDFVDGGDAGDRRGRLLDFGGGATENPCTGTAGRGRVDLFWSDPLRKSKNDYDVYVVDSSGDVLRFSDDAQRGRQNPYETIRGFDPGERLVVTKFRGDNRFIHVDVGRSRLGISTAGCVRGHNAAVAAHAFSVAATSAEDANSPFTGGASNPVESFSSDGPRRMFYDAKGKPFTPGDLSSTGGIVFQKPDITAADGTETTVPGFAAFFGTSAAAPHAAAIAGLILSANRNITPEEVRAVLQDTADDIEAPGFDRDSGFGVIDAEAALLQVITNTPNLRPFRPNGWSAPIVVSTTTGTTTDSANLAPGDTLRVDIAVSNKGRAATAAGATVRLFVDEVEHSTFNIPSGLAAGSGFNGLDRNIGSLPAGLHTISMRIDDEDDVSEFNEGDNFYSKTIFVVDGGGGIADQGTFTGTIVPANDLAPDFRRYGSFSLKLGRRNSFTVKVSIGDQQNRFKGKILENGDAEFKIGRDTGLGVLLTLKDGRQVTLSFNVDELASAGQVRGQLVAADTGDVESIIVAERGAYSKRDPAPDTLPGKYTALVETNETELPGQSLPIGFGIGSASVDKGGKVKIKGKLSDGTGFGFSGVLTASNSVPFHALVGKKKEMITGVLRFRDLPGLSDFDAKDLAWIKLPNKKAPSYRNGWVEGITANMIGSRYDRGRRDAAFSFLPATDTDGNARLLVSGTAGFPVTFVNALNIDDRDKVKVVDGESDKLKMKVKGKSGTFGGTFADPNSRKKVKYFGVVFDKQNAGGGYFLYEGEGGQISLSPDTSM